MKIFLLSILFAFLDFAMFSLLKQQVFHFLIIFYSLVILETDINSNIFLIPLSFICLEESITLGLFGPSLIFLIPLSFIALKMKKIFFKNSYFLTFTFLITTLFIELFLVKTVLCGQKLIPYSTFSAILCNMLVMIIYLKFLKNNGVLSNRSLKHNERKVRTPNRMDALGD